MELVVFVITYCNFNSLDLIVMSTLNILKNNYLLLKIWYHWIIWILRENWHALELISLIILVHF